MEKIFRFIRAVYQARMLLKDEFVYVMGTNSFIRTEVHEPKQTLKELENWLRELIQDEESSNHANRLS
jgi:hypothetical protein